MIIFIVVVMFIIIYFVAQNNRVQNLFDHLIAIDRELEEKLQRYNSEKKQVDIFTIQEIRSMITKDYIHRNRIDDFRIYKESVYKIKLIIKHGIAVQVLEWRTNEKDTHLRETVIQRSDLELLKE